jgi:hypothetical protein
MWWVDDDGPLFSDAVPLVLVVLQWRCIDGTGYIDTLDGVYDEDDDVYDKMMIDSTVI